jgi:eukaryotic-like serine/threonine-protein kinase
MSLSVGASFGAYTIVRFVGAGGMGEVYQARDVRLNRDVALKVLPVAVAHDQERLARFKREAQTLAALSHPNIGAIYGLEESGGISALVLEFIEGRTLADVIHGPSTEPRGQPWFIARQIAEALQAAHEKGIIHRDLKPANVKITPDGRVKVLDFGLAKVSESSQGYSVAISLSPTITTPAMTQAGMILGTAAYMSPEQAKGLAADKRSDIWSYGCLLFEMLTGSRPFEAEDVAETLAAVLMREPDWTRLPPTLPRSVHTLLRRCLERDRSKRLADVAGVLFALDEALDAPSSHVQPAVQTPARTSVAYAGWLVAALVAVVATTALVRRAPPVAPTMRLQIVTPSSGNPMMFALSPDGQSVVYQVREQGRVQLWLRRLESEDNRPLTNTDGALYPFWSPDARSVAFFADGLLKRIDLASGFVRVIAPAPVARSGVWGSAGTILFGPSAGPLFRVSAEGGAVEQATVLTRGQSSHRAPQFLPDGRRFLLLALGEAHVKGVYLASLDGKNVTRLLDGEPPFLFLPPAHMLIVRQGALWAQRLNVDAAKVEGELQPVAPRVFVHRTTNGLAALSASSAGSFAYRAAAESRELVWFDRAGRSLGVIGQADDTQVGEMRLSPDGRTAVVSRAVNGNTDLWLLDLARGSQRRLTFGPAVEGKAVFSPDGNRVGYSSDPTGGLWDIFERRQDGTGDETPLWATPENENPIDWSPDGRHLLYMQQSAKTDYDVWALPIVGDRKPFPVAQTTFAEQDARFSPDGRWVAFESTESGRREIYVQPFPGPGVKMQISSGGGRLPRWPPRGRDIFYLAPDNRVMAVSVTERGSSLEAGTPQALFSLLEVEEYEPSLEGQRFLINRVVSPASPITIVLNWKP